MDISEAREFNSFHKRYAHALTNISEAKEHSTNGDMKHSIKPYSKDISEVHGESCK